MQMGAIPQDDVMTIQKHITIVGAGLMGHGIALVMARAGHSVTVTDPVSESRDALPERVLASAKALEINANESAALFNRISVCKTLEDAVKQADIVFEAAPEKLELKQQIFAEIEMYASPHCILASNTSVIPISQIMQNLASRHRALGTHWWNPPHIIPLVEIVKTQWTAPEVANEMLTLLTKANKTPVMVEKDVPGFIGNRLQHALWREAISLVESGICSAEVVDTVVKASFGRRLAVLGPLENADLIGTDLTLDIHENVLFDLENRQEPSPYLRQIVADGRLGMKTGFGFRKWKEGEAEIIRNRVNNHLCQLEK